jgi:tetratricopeptide (TPR) repeat protein
MEISSEINKSAHIDAIRRRMGVTLETIFRYNSEHRNEIEHLDDIFYLKGSGREKVLALLYMFSSGEKDEVIRRYCEQTGLNSPEFYPAGRLDQYTVLLLTALVYDQSFYALAVNYREAINAGLAVRESGENSLDPAVAESHIIPFHTAPGGFHKTPRFLITAAGFVVIFFFAILIGVSNTGLGPRVNNAWVLNLKEPEKELEGNACVSMENNGARIGLLSPLMGMTMGTKGKNADTNLTISHYTKTIRQDRNNSNLYVNRGIAYTLNGYLDSAVKDFNKAIELDPQNASAYYNRAIANTGRDAEFGVTIADLETAIAINPGDKDAYYALGVLYYRRYEKEETKPAAILDKAIDAFSRITDYKDSYIILDYLGKINSQNP